MPLAHTPARSVWAPRFWLLHLVGAACVLAAAALGWWQLEAWQERREAEARDLTQVDPVPLAQVMGPDDPFPGDRVGQPVELSGTWVPAGTVYVEGREQDGRDGHWVVTPLEVGPGDSALLVVRGWVEDAGDAPPPPTGSAELVGWLQPGEGRRGVVDQDPDDDVLPQLRVADALQHVDQDLYGAYAVAREPVGDLEPASLDQLPEVGRFTAVRNLLYALEWWLFGLFAAFVWWRWVRDQQELAREAEAAAASDEPAA